MEASALHSYLGTLWCETGESLRAACGSMNVDLRVTAPPREAHKVTDTSRILRISCEDEQVIVWLSHR